MRKTIPAKPSSLGKKTTNIPNTAPLYSQGASPERLASPKDRTKPQGKGNSIGAQQLYGSSAVTDTQHNLHQQPKKNSGHLSGASHIRKSFEKPNDGLTHNSEHEMNGKTTNPDTDVQFDSHGHY